MAGVRKQLQRRMRDRFCECFRGGRRRHDFIGVARDDGDWDRYLAKAFRREDRSRPRRHGEDGADARIPIGVSGLGVALPEIRIGDEARLGLLAHLGSRRRRVARSVGRRRAAERLQPCRIGNTTGGREYGVAAERMTGGADPRRVDQAAENFVGQHRVDHRAEIDGAQPPQRRALDRVIRERVVAGVIDRDGDKTVRRQCGAEPCKLVRPAAITVRQQDERT